MMLRIDSTDVLVQECKRSKDGRAWIVRLFGAADESRKARMTWAQSATIKLWRSNLNEEQLEAAEQLVEVGPCELITLRMEVAHA